MSLARQESIKESELNTGVEETMHYVPVLKTLDVILQNETVLAEVSDFNIFNMHVIMWNFVFRFIMVIATQDT